MVEASAPAKVILFGEHFVVYDEPAIVLAIDKRAHTRATLRRDNRIYIRSDDLKASGFFEGGRFQTEKGGKEAETKLQPIRTVIQKILAKSDKNIGVNVEIESLIPVAVGLGSSAAVAASVAAAVGQLLDVELSSKEIFQLAYEAERLVHGTPSGIDPAVATYGGALVYRKNEGFEPLQVEADIPLVIGNTGMQRSTGKLVALVRRRRNRYPTIIEPIIKAGGEITQKAVEALKRGDFATLGELMNINQALLSAVGVSNEALERLIHAAMNAGAFGAKLTGGGGGGCMVALASRGKLRQIAEAIEKAGGTAFTARKTDEGVRIEQKT
ncbi:MAG: mevalonate kinase [Candidatus Bathyarchaeia archaeon]